MMDAKTKLYGGRSNGSKIAPKREPTLSRNLVSLVTSNKCLGVLLDEELTFETHIEYICKKACVGIGALRRIKPFVPLCTLVIYADHSFNLILITAHPCGIHVVSN